MANGGVGSNQYQTRGRPRAQATASRVATFTRPAPPAGRYEALAVELEAAARRRDARVPLDELVTVAHYAWGPDGQAGGDRAASIWPYLRLDERRKTHRAELAGFPRIELEPGQVFTAQTDVSARVVQRKRECGHGPAIVTRPPGHDRWLMLDGHHGSYAAWVDGGPAPAVDVPWDWLFPTAGDVDGTGRGVVLSTSGSNHGRSSS